MSLTSFLRLTTSFQCLEGALVSPTTFRPYAGDATVQKGREACNWLGATPATDDGALQEIVVLDVQTMNVTGSYCSGAMY